MKITKLGHCCLVIEENGIKILTDPGMLSTAQNEVKGINLVLITHEHPDHLHFESVMRILDNNPKVPLITNSAVRNILHAVAIPCQVLEDKQSTTFKEISIEAFGNEHAEIYKDFKRVQNTGYFIANRFFYPGDALYVPGKPVEILALPVAGPWVKIKEAIDYAKEVKPKVCFPVHDGILSFVGPFHETPRVILEEAGIEFIPMLAHDQKEF
jgi:L-ascorbate metabolism protein UlaG (beta-lactamase superfamily)